MRATSIDESSDAQAIFLIDNLKTVMRAFLCWKPHLTLESTVSMQETCSLKIELTLTKIWAAHRHAMTNSIHLRFASVKSFSFGSSRVYCRTSRRFLDLVADDEIVVSDLQDDSVGYYSSYRDAFVICLSWVYVNANMKPINYQVVRVLKKSNFNSLVLVRWKIESFTSTIKDNLTI